MRRIVKPEAAAAVAGPGVKLRSGSDQLLRPAAMVLGSGRSFFLFLLPTNNPVSPINAAWWQPGLRLFISWGGGTKTECSSHLLLSPPLFDSHLGNRLDNTGAGHGRSVCVVQSHQ